MQELVLFSLFHFLTDGTYLETTGGWYLSLSSGISGGTASRMSVLALSLQTIICVCVSWTELNKLVYSAQSFIMLCLCQLRVQFLQCWCYLLTEHVLVLPTKIWFKHILFKRKRLGATYNATMPSPEEVFTEEPNHTHIRTHTHVQE